MVKSLKKVVYKPDVNSTFEYTVIINPEEYKKYKAGDTTVPLVEVLDSFQVFRSEQGSQGLLGKPSNQELDNDFGTHRDDEVVKVMLEKGKEQSGDSLAKQGYATQNISRGGGNDQSRR